jgi:hypothetical protein
MRVGVARFTLMMQESGGEADYRQTVTENNIRLTGPIKEC